MPYMPTDTECSELNPGICGKDATPTMIDNCNSIHIDGIDDVTINQGVGIDLTDGVTAYDSTGAEIPFEVHPEEIDKCEVGEHKVTYSAIGADEKMLPSLCGDNFVEITCSGLSKLIKDRLVTITQADPPTFSGVGDVELDVGEPFNPMDGVTGVDDNGNTVDVSYYGEYDDYAEGDIASFETDLMHPFRSLQVNIDPVQDLHGYDKPWVGGSGKNKLPMDLTYIKSVNTSGTWNNNAYTRNGVTFTINDNSTVTVSGTATSNAIFYLNTNISLLQTGTDYKLNGNSGAYAATRLQANFNGATGGVSYEGIDASFTTPAEINTMDVYIAVLSGQTVSNLVIHPMIRLATESDATFAPWENLCPITGWTECEVDVAGVNLWHTDFTNSGGGLTKRDGEMEVNISAHTSTTYLLGGSSAFIGYELKAGTYTLSAQSNDFTGIYVTLSDGTTWANGETKTFATEVIINNVRCETKGLDVGTYTLHWQLQIEYGSTATPYTPYNGTTYPVSWETEAGTVYGGTLDLVTGVLTATMPSSASIDLGTLNYSYYGNGIFYHNLNGRASGGQNLMCSAYPTSNVQSWTSIEDKAVVGNIANSYIYIRDTNYSDVAAFKSAMSGVQLVYELATPQTYQLDPVQVACLLGQNNVWVDCGDVYVEYSKTIPSSGNITYPLDGIYSIIYSATDQCGNVGTVIRNIIVGDFSTILFADGTLVFNVLPQDVASYVAEHGSISKTYPALYGENDYVFNNSSDVYWYSEMASIISVEFSMPIHPTSMAYWFKSATNLVSFDPTNLDTSNVTDMTHTFSKCQSLVTLDVTSFDTSNVVTFYGTFLDCKSLTTLDVSGFDTSNATRLTSMFQNCESLTTLDVSGFDTSKNTSLYHTFGRCESVTTLDVSGFDTSNVTDMQGTFEGCKLVTTLDVSGFDTSNVLLMSSMFGGCESLTSIDVTGFDTRNVTKMWSMFERCLSLPSLDVTHFDTSNVNDMHNMFRRCILLTSLDVSNFDTRKVTDMAYMFASMNALTTLDLSNFDTGSVTNMSYMFSYTYALVSLNISSFDTSNVTTMKSMFHTCALTTINICSFDTSSVTIMNGMFEYADCVTINVSEDFVVTQVTDSTNMFYVCSNVVGGDGTTYDVNYIDKTRAKIDGGVGNEGYFTECTGAIVGLAYVGISSI